MPKDIMKLKRERQAKVAEMRAVLDVADKGNRELFDEEGQRYAALKEEVDKRDAEIRREEELAALEAAAAVPVPEEQTHDFRSLSEFVREIASGRISSRVQKRTTVMDGSDVSAGYLVPPKFLEEIFAISPQDAVIRPRAYRLPSPPEAPDTTVIIPALDQSGTKGVYSGVQVTWTEETAARSASPDPTWRRIETRPHEVSAFVRVSNKILNNSAAIDTWLRKLLQQAIISTEEKAFLTGNGTTQPKGIIGHPSTITVERTGTAVGGAKPVTYDDIVNMYALAISSKLVWIANRTLLPQLMKLKDAAGNMIWQPNLREGEPSTLLGVPVVYNERSPAGNAAGALLLADLNYYVVRDGSPLALMVNQYSEMENGITKIFAFWNVDGKPMLTSPLTQEDGTTQVSPFISLGAAA